ncbi:hypothetical protein AAMO2058_000852200 [Amorphochlora amoebiformis]
MGNSAISKASREHLAKADTIVVKNKKYIAQDNVVKVVEDLQIKLNKERKRADSYQEDINRLKDKLESLMHDKDKTSKPEKHSIRRKKKRLAINTRLRSRVSPRSHTPPVRQRSVSDVARISSNSPPSKIPTLGKKRMNSVSNPPPPLHNAPPFRSPNQRLSLNRSAANESLGQNKYPMLKDSFRRTSRSFTPNRTRSPKQRCHSLPPTSVTKKPSLEEALKRLSEFNLTHRGRSGSASGSGGNVPVVISEKPPDKLPDIPGLRDRPALMRSRSHTRKVSPPPHSDHNNKAGLNLTGRSSRPKHVRSQSHSFSPKPLLRTSGAHSGNQSRKSIFSLFRKKNHHDEAGAEESEMTGGDGSARKRRGSVDWRKVGNFFSKKLGFGRRDSRPRLNWGHKGKPGTLVKFKAQRDLLPDDLPELYEMIKTSLTFPTQRHRRGSYVLYNNKLDLNNVWQSELAPRKFLNFEDDEHKRRRGKSPAKGTPRRRSLAVYTTVQDSQLSDKDIEISLDEKNAEKYVHLTPVYAFKITAEQARSLGGFSEDLSSNPASPISRMRNISRAPSCEDGCITRSLHLPAMSPTPSGLYKKAWIVVSLDKHLGKVENGNGSQNKVTVCSEEVFEETYTPIDRYEHKYAKVTPVFAVVVRRDAKLKALGSEKLDSEEKRLEFDPTISLPSMAAATAGEDGGKTKMFAIGHALTVGVAGDFLVQDQVGHQWFARPNIFKEHFILDSEYKRFCVGSLQTVNGHDKLESRNLWCIQKPKPTTTMLIPTRQCLEHLQHIREWTFDIFKLADYSMNKPLYHTGYMIFKRFGLFECEDISIDPDIFKRFLIQAEAAYLDNPYHNALHGADVCQASAHFLSAVSDRFPSAKNPVTNHPLGLTSLELLAFLLAGLVHDIGHPGSNNAFQIATGSELAVFYNDRSVLESFHAAEAFSILRKTRFNFLNKLPQSQFQALRHIVIELILATDLEHHREVIHQFELKCKECAIRLGIEESNIEPGSPMTPDGIKKTSSGSTSCTDKASKESASVGDIRKNEALVGAEKTNAQSQVEEKKLKEDKSKRLIEEVCKSVEGRLLLLKLLIKCADISHPARPWPIHARWCKLIQEEFFQQGDREAALGLPVSRGMDRKASSSVSIAKGNVGFIRFIVNPLFNLMTTHLDNPKFGSNIAKNLSYWNAQAAEKANKRATTLPDLSKSLSLAFAASSPDPPHSTAEKVEEKRACVNSGRRRITSPKMHPPVIEEIG